MELWGPHSLGAGGWEGRGGRACALPSWLTVFSDVKPWKQNNIYIYKYIYIYIYTQIIIQYFGFYTFRYLSTLGGYMIWTCFQKSYLTFFDCYIVSGELYSPLANFDVCIRCSKYCLTVQRLLVRLIFLLSTNKKPIEQLCILQYVSHWIRIPN